MRGVAPMIVASTSGFILHESLSPLAIAGVAIISSGVLTLAFESGFKHRRSLVFALMNALVIGTYTYVDGIGSRAAGNPIAYTIWISILPPIPLFAFAIWQRGLAPVSAHIRTNWWRGLIGGAGSITSYGLALWAMSRAPIALVAALRETSILFALLISIFILKEKPGKWRILAGMIIGAGALVLKLG
jgi:drug/metabolite transporter (DMT)-like permease